MRMLALAATALLVLTGCVRIVGVKVDGPAGRPEFSTVKPRKACVYAVDVITDDKPVKGQWRIRSQDGCKRLDRLVYGALPAGFTAEGPAEPLDPAKTYVISVRTSSGNGHVAFALDEGRYRLVD